MSANSKTLSTNSRFSSRARQLLRKSLRRIFLPTHAQHCLLPSRVARRTSRNVSFVQNGLLAQARSGRTALKTRHQRRATATTVARRVLRIDSRRRHRPRRRRLNLTFNRYFFGVFSVDNCVVVLYTQDYITNEKKRHFNYEKNHFLHGISTCFVNV